jgi:hypothetical protein
MLGGAVKYQTELRMLAGGLLDDPRISALSDALFAIDAADPAIEDMDVTASLADNRVIVAMTVEAADHAEAAGRALHVIHDAIAANGEATIGWEVARSVIQVAAADTPDRLLASA